jgi:hypothetical protein
MINKKIIVPLIILLVFATSCAKNENKTDELPGIKISIQEMNKVFLIEDSPISKNSHKNGELLVLALRNLSGNIIVFPKNYRPGIFLKQGQTWVNVQNNMAYTAGGEILPTHDAFPLGMVIGVYPYIQGLREPANIRIVMVGHNENSDTEVVGAYIDITLLP